MSLDGGTGAESSMQLAVIGNCSVSALIDDRGAIVWACLPDFAGDPAFCSLLDPVDRDMGFLDVVLHDSRVVRQEYLPNTPVLRTEIEDASGAALEILDFSPRYRFNERLYHPMAFVRILRPLRGLPRIQVRVRPGSGYGTERAARTVGSNHIRYLLADTVLRLTTDIPVPVIDRELPWILERPVAMIFGPDEMVGQAVGRFAQDSLDRTVAYWREWCRSLSIPLDWQEAVLRAAITLKLTQFEGTGAIVAAFTTSLPEAPGTTRNWDYRYCWLRDAAFVVRALNLLGATLSMELYLNYVFTIASGSPVLQPVYGIDFSAALHESVAPRLQGYRGMGPVRVGNDAWRQVQNDTYGSVILAASHLFFDQRLEAVGDEASFARLERLGDEAFRRFDQPDAGPWELRGSNSIHTYSAVMSWAACDRLARIAEHLGLSDRATLWRERADELHQVIESRAFSQELGHYVSVFDGDALDAALLLLPHLGFVSARDPRFVGTLDAISRDLVRGDYLLRYAAPDDFGIPTTAFVACTFWFIDALAAAGRVEEARQRFTRLLAARNNVGLLSEDIAPDTGEHWGNFPQTYSMVGIIQSARLLSRPWEVAS